MLFGLTSRMEVPLGERGKTSLDSRTLRNDECAAWYRPLLVYTSATQRYQWVSCRRSMLMKQSRGFIISQPVGWIRNAFMLTHGVWHWNKSLCISSDGTAHWHYLFTCRFCNNYKLIILCGSYRSIEQPYYYPFRYSHDQSWLAWSNPMTIDQSTSPRQTNRRPHSGGVATNQLNNIVRELQVHLATLTLPTSGFAWSIFISDSQSQRLSITPTSLITQYRHNGTQSNGSAVRKHCSQPWDSHNQSLAQQALNYQSIDITMHTHPLNIESVVTNIHKPWPCIHTHIVLWLAYSQSSTQRPIRLHHLLNSLASVVPNVSSIIKQSSLDVKTDQCWSPSKGRYAMTNIIIILPS